MKALVVVLRDDGKVVAYQSDDLAESALMPDKLVYVGDVGHRAYSSPRGLYDAIEDFCKKEPQ